MYRIKLQDAQKAWDAISGGYSGGQVRFSVSFILGPEADGVGGMISSSTADMGGLIANGEGTAAGWPNTDAEGPRLKPKFGKFAGGCGLAPAPPDGVVGAAPLLNSAHRGHFRLVSAEA